MKSGCRIFDKLTHFTKKMPGLQVILEFILKETGFIKSSENIKFWK
jgi:hypothetical protein